MFITTAVIYTVVRDFGATARPASASGALMQAIFLPAMAIAFATAPVAGQNVGVNVSTTRA